MSAKPSPHSVATNSSTRVIKIKRLGDTSKWMQEEVETFTESAVRFENRRQEKIGNELSRIVVDRRSDREASDTDRKVILRTPLKTRLFFSMKRRLSFYYVGVADIAEAFMFAYTTIQGLLRHATGDAKKRMNFYVKNWETGEGAEFVNPTAVVRWLTEATTTDVTAYIQGPTPEYRRTAIYYHNGPGGKQRQSTYFDKQSAGYKKDPSRRGLDRLRFTSPGSKVRVGKGHYETAGSGILLKGSRRGKRTQYQMLLAKAVHVIARDRVRRQFRDVRVRYAFNPGRGVNAHLPVIHSPKWRPDGQNIHIPVLMISSKKSGSTRAR